MDFQPIAPRFTLHLVPFHLGDAESIYPSDVTAPTSSSINLVDNTDTICQARYIRGPDYSDPPQGSPYTTTTLENFFQLFVTDRDNMDTEKRKRDDSGETEDVKEKRLKPEDGKGGESGKTVSDSEVEEFFAILRRIHVAVKYFEKRNGGRRELRAKDQWNPVFRAEDFQEETGVTEDGEKTEGCVAGRLGLDLNLDPTS
ncbi:hypothetical protein CJ030_MR3G018965 [Morella rubra]|uniref:Protein NIM1-INTERACTING 2 n=1 Tax=Morella rubra TaxID=262757 RepID=A0A6A1WDX5_9ROSI|nr:hypothetical protein CJ030_MR3G018965 [Morella rubra]